MERNANSNTLLLQASNSGVLYEVKAMPNVEVTFVRTSACLWISASNRTNGYNFWIRVF